MGESKCSSCFRHSIKTLSHKTVLARGATDAVNVYSRFKVFCALTTIAEKTDTVGHTPNLTHASSRKECILTAASNL